MYILTICEIIDDINILWQQANPDQDTLKAAAIAWVKAKGWWELDEEEALSPDEEFEQVRILFGNAAEADDPRMILRKADA
jgi:hypothetical protein